MKPVRSGSGLATATAEAKSPVVGSVVIGTAGHIDHGKTALVYALTGTDTDRLPEEKRRGITIDLGFAVLRVPNANGGLLEISLIDVPGHHAFIRNMVAGAGTVDCVMLVIAADEGVKEQTREHLAICSLLGIRRGLVALTKTDSVSAERLQDAQESIRRFLQPTFLNGAPVLPVSAHTGEGVVELRAALASLSSSASDRSEDFFPRLPLDRVFSMHGFGTVVTGTLQRGVLRTGDFLEGPHGRAVRVRGVQVHGENRDVAQAPCRVALNMADVEVAEIHRGDTLVPPRTLSAVNTLDVEISILSDAPALKHRSQVRMHAFTAESLATVLLYDSGGIAGSNKALARLQLAKPMVSVPGDRFVLRQCSPAITIGGGRVLDANPIPRVKKSMALRWLNELKDASPAEQLQLRVARRGTAGISIAQLIAEMGMTAEAIRRHAESLIANKRLAACGPAQSEIDYFVSSEALAQVVKAIRAELERVASGSMQRAELRSRNAFEERIFGLAIARLAEAKHVEIKGDLLVLPGRSEQIPEAQRNRLNAIEKMYATAGLAAPLLSEVSGRTGIPPKEMHALITLLLRSKRLVRMGADNAFVHSQPLAKLYADLRNHRGQQFDIARFKSFTGLTRKHAIPLLEHLDQMRVTRNTGGVRVVL